MRIGKKTIHSVIIGLAMALPILYLGGSLVACLAGAHGSSGLSADYEIVTESRNIDFNQNIDNGNFSTSNLWSYDPLYYSLEVNANRGIFSSLQSNSRPIYNSAYVDIAIDDVCVLTFEASSSVAVNDFRVQLWQSSPSVYSFLELNISLSSTLNRYSYRFTSPNASNLLRVYFFPSFNVGLDVGSLFTLSNVQLFNLTKAFGSGEEPSTDDFLSFFDGSYYDYTLSKNVTYYTEGVPSFSQYLFNQFFSKDNFVSQIGVNALSESPKGFAPFGTMLSFLDENMFHAGDSQTALMVYGMVYWSLHVVLADLVYHVLVFVPNLINRVFDWFGQKGVSDE